jgi:hypothetical protein
MTYFVRGSEGLRWQYTPDARSWMTYPILAQSGLHAITYPTPPVPAFSATASAVQALSQKVFIILFSLNAAASLARPPTRIAASKYPARLSLLNPVLFPTATVILCLCFAIALLLYSRRPKSSCRDHRRLSHRLWHIVSQATRFPR